MSSGMISTDWGKLLQNQRNRSTELNNLLKNLSLTIWTAEETRKVHYIHACTMLPNHAHDLQSITHSSKGKKMNMVNKDGEHVGSISTPNTGEVHTQLHRKLKKQHLYCRCRQKELERLCWDTQQQQKLLAQNLCKNYSSNLRLFCSLNLYILLTSENFSFQGQVCTITEQMKKYKFQVL